MMTIIYFLLWYQVSLQTRLLMASPACCLSLQVQQCWTLSAGAFNAEVLGMVGGAGPFLDCSQPHHHHWPGHQCLHHPGTCVLLPNCH